MKIKNLIKGLIVIATMGCVIALCSHVLMLKSEDGIMQMKAFYKQKDQTVDVLFVGNSHTYCNINSGDLWDHYGISSFNLGGAEQPYWNTYYYVLEALKTQTPKVIVMDITAPGINPTDYQPENWVICNNYGMKWNKNRIDALKVSTIEQTFPRLLVPLNSIHGRYVELTKNDFFTKEDSINYKGFDFRDSDNSYETPDISNVTDRIEISEKEEKYLRMTIEYILNKNIPLVFVSAPYVVTEQSQGKYNYIFDIAEEYQIPYVDFNKKYDELNIDFQSDFADELHLNWNGNKKYSLYLGDMLKSMYGLPDHRGDQRYESWEKNARIHEHERLASELTKVKNVEEYLGIVNNADYIVFASYPDGRMVVISDGKELFSSNENEFRMNINEGNHQLLLIRTADENEETTTLLFDNEQKNTIRSSEELCIFVYDRILQGIVDKANFSTTDFMRE